MAEEMDSLETAQADFLKDAGTALEVMERKRFIENPNAFSGQRRDALDAAFNEKLQDAEVARQQALLPAPPSPGPTIQDLQALIANLNTRVNELQDEAPVVDGDPLADPIARETSSRNATKLEDMTATGFNAIIETESGGLEIEGAWRGAFMGHAAHTSDAAPDNKMIEVEDGYVTMNADTILFSSIVASREVDVSANISKTVYVYLIVDYAMEDITGITLIASVSRPNEGVIEESSVQSARRVIGIAKTNADGEVIAWEQQQIGHIYIGGGGGGSILNRWWDQDDDAYLEQNTEPFTGAFELKKGASWMGILEDSGGTHINNNHQRCVD